MEIQFQILVNSINKMFVMLLRINKILMIKIKLEMILNYRDSILNFKITNTHFKKIKIMETQV